MDIKTEPAFTEEPVIDYDLFTPHGIESITLHEGEAVHEFDDRFEFTRHKPDELLVVYKSQLTGYCRRSRMIRTPIALPEAIQAKADPTGHP